MEPTLRRDRAGRHAPQRTPGALLERLEPRIILSDTYYSWTGVDTLPGYDASYGVADTIVGASDDGRFLWSAGAADPADPDEPYLVAEGAVRYLRDVPGLTGATIVGVNSSGVAFATDHEGADAGRLFRFDLMGAQVRGYLDEDDLDAPQDFDLTGAAAVAITDGGGFVLTTPAGHWIVIDDSVTYLWAGRVVDVSADNGVLGFRLSGSSATSILWTPDRGFLDLGQEGLHSVASLNNDGTIFGDSAEGLVLWRNCQTESLGYVDVEESPERRGSVYSPLSRSVGGVFVVREAWLRGHSSGTIVAARSTDGSVCIPPVEGAAYLSLRTTESGIILPARKVNESYQIRGGWYRVVAPPDDLLAAPAARTVSWTEGGLLTVLTRDSEGNWLQFTRSPDGSVVATAPGYPGGPAALEQWDVITSHASGKVLVVRTADGVFSWIDPGDRDIPIAFALAQGAIHDGVTGFFDAHDLPAVAGLADNGHVLLAFGRTINGQLQTRLADLFSDHLARRGLETPDFVGQLDSYRTTRGGMHVLGLDSAGDLRALWWGPGLRSPLWTTTNLSTLTGAPRLVGNIAADATPWGGMQIMGTDEGGNLIAIWWSPKTRQWRYTDLTRQNSGVELEPGTITMRINAGGMICTAGKGPGGDVVVYTWSPASSWHNGSVAIRQSPLLAGPVSLVVEGAGQRHVLATTQEGHLIDLYQEPPPGSPSWWWRSFSVLAMG